MDDEIVIIDGLYAFIDIDKYDAYLRRVCDGVSVFKEEDMPLRVNTLYPATDLDSCWVSVSDKSRTSTSFPVDLVKRFTNIIPKWDQPEGQS